MGVLSLHILLFGISGGEILIILLAVLVLFGPKKIPEIARMLGRGINEIKKVQREINSEIHRYSADIEHEARNVQDSIDEMKKGLRAMPEESSAGSPQQEAGSPENRGEGQGGEEGELPYPYNQKTGKGP